MIRQAAWMWGLATAALLLPLLLGAGSGAVDGAHGLSFALLSQLATNSLAVASGAALVATLLAVPVALSAMRLEGPRGRAVVLALAAAPLLVAPTVLAVVAVQLFGPAGWFTGWIEHGQPTFEVTTPLVPPTAAGLKASPIYTLTGASLTLAAAFLPLAVLAISAALARIDRQSEEAALLDAPLWRVIARLSLPLARPGIAAAAALVFLLALTEFSIPEALRNQPVLVAEVYAQFGIYSDTRSAALCALGLTGLAALAVVLAAIVGGRAAELQSETPSRADRTHPAGGAAPPVLRWIGRCLAALPIAAALGILVSTARGADGIAATLSTTWRTCSEQFWFSQLLSLAAAALSAIAGFALALGLSRAARPGVARWIVALPLVLPSPVLAVGMSVLLHRPPGSLPLGIDGWLADAAGTVAPLLAVWTLRFAPVVALLAEHALRAIPAEHWEAARLEGAGPLRRAMAIALPEAWPALLAGAAIAYGLSLGEVGAAIILIPPGPTTLAVRLLTLMHYAPTAQVSALCLFIAAPALAAGGAVIAAARPTAR